MIIQHMHALNIPSDQKNNTLQNIKEKKYNLESTMENLDVSLNGTPEIFIQEKNVHCVCVAEHLDLYYKREGISVTFSSTIGRDIYSKISITTNMILHDLKENKLVCLWIKNKALNINLLKKKSPFNNLVLEYPQDDLQFFFKQNVLTQMCIYYDNMLSTFIQNNQLTPVFYSIIIENINFNPKNIHDNLVHNCQANISVNFNNSQINASILGGEFTSGGKNILVLDTDNFKNMPWLKRDIKQSDKKEDKMQENIYSLRVKNKDYILNDIIKEL